jgi:GT2 family glycosyltransferase
MEKRRVSTSAGSVLEPQTGPVRVTVAIVTYCSETELPACLDSVLVSDIPVKVVVIDNGSTDGTLELARRYAQQHPNVLALPSGGNIGLAAGNNVVIPHLEGDYALMLNPDTVVRPDTLSTLISIMTMDRSIGVVGPKCVYEDGRPHTSYHLAWNFWHLFLWRVLPYSLIRLIYDRLARYRETDVDFVSGACLMVRTELFKQIGGYDPGYFLTVEDVCDLCRRIKALGFRILFTPRAQITHLCGRSGAHVPYLSTLEAYKGDVYHFGKHHGEWARRIAFALVVTACTTKVDIDAQNYRVYRRVLPVLFADGPSIGDPFRR